MHSRLTQGVRPSLEGKQRILLTCPVSPGISWSPLSGLKGAKPPVEFGKRILDCSPVHAGKRPSSRDDGGVSWVFSGCGISSGFLMRYERELRQPLVWHQGSQVFMSMVRGSASLLSIHGMGIGPQDALKKDSRGISRVAAANPGFPQLVPVTSGSFSGFL